MGERGPVARERGVSREVGVGVRVEVKDTYLGSRHDGCRGCRTAWSDGASGWSSSDSHGGWRRRGDLHPGGGG